MITRARTAKVGTAMRRATILLMRTIVIAAAALLLFALTGCTAAATTTIAGPELVAITPAPTTFDANAYITFSDRWADVENGTCYPYGPYDDMSLGSQWVLTDNTGATVSIGEVSSVVVADLPGHCLAAVRFWNIPEAPSYRLVVGARPPYDVTAADLKDGLDLRIG